MHKIFKMAITTGVFICISIVYSYSAYAVPVSSLVTYSFTGSAEQYSNFIVKPVSGTMIMDSNFQFLVFDPRPSGIIAGTWLIPSLSFTSADLNTTFNGSGQIRFSRGFDSNGVPSSYYWYGFTTVSGAGSFINGDKDSMSGGQELCLNFYNKDGLLADFYTLPYEMKAVSFNIAFHDADNVGGSFLLSNFNATQVPPPPVPEPSTMLLLSAGFVGLAAYGRKRNKK